MMVKRFTVIKASSVTETTSYMGRIRASYADLVAAFGPPQPGDGEKTAAEWWMRFADGTIASIYDYKTSLCYDPDGLPPEEITAWHIGGRKAQAVRHVLAVLGDKAEILDPVS